MRKPTGIGSFMARRYASGFQKPSLTHFRTAAELVEHHPGRARVHGVVPVESADRIEREILVVDAIILYFDPVLILDPIFGHGLIPT